MPHGAYDETLRPLVSTDLTRVRALLPVLDARLVLYKTTSSSITK